MKSREWVYLFISTLAVGGLFTGVIGFIIKWDEYEKFFTSLNIGEIFFSFIWFVGVGCTFSAISQAGFFAYLTIHRFGLGLFKSVSLWNLIQVGLIVFALFDLVYFRYSSFAKEGDSILPYIGVMLFLLIISLMVAYIKRKQTNKETFVPALFFMVVATLIEWWPVLKINEPDWFYLMLLPLLICNAYQMLILHKLVEKSMVTSGIAKKG